MKKAKVLALVLAVALMLSGIGYALWSDSIVLTSTASTGNIDVDFVAAKPNCLGGETEGRAHAEVNELTLMDGNYYLGHDPVDKAEDASDDWNDAYFTEDAIYFTVSNLYPNAKYELKYAVRNNGTVPVVLKGQAVEFVDGYEDLFLQLKGKISTEDYSDILNVEDETDFLTSFEVPNWRNHDFENKWCTIKITLNWEQVEVTGITTPAE